MYPSYHSVLNKYFSQCGGRHIIFHQIESFNTFMNIDIPEIIQNVNPIIIKGSPEIPLSGPRSALASATGLSTSAANALMGFKIDSATALSGPKHEYEIHMKFENLSFRKPTIFENNGAVLPMMPNDARLRNLTYASPLFIDVRIKTVFIDNTKDGVRTVRERLFPNVHMGKIPIMVGSKYCLLHDQTYVHPKVLGECAEDFGGYFIISGGERVIISQERMSENRPFVFRNNKSNNKDIEVIEVKSIGPDNDQVPKSNMVKIVYHPKNSQIHLLKANIPRIKNDIPLFILFRAFGVTKDKEIHDLIIGKEGDLKYFSLFNESIQESSFIKTQEEAFAYIGSEMNNSSSKNTKQNNMKIQDLIYREVFPHVGLKEEDNYAKACYLAHMTRKLLWVDSCKIPIDDRDAYPNKRVDLPGFLLASLFRTYFNNKMVKDIRSSIAKEIHNGSWRASGNFEDIVNLSNINKIIKSVIMEVGLKTSLATGNFGSAKIGGPTKIGVSQVLNRLNYVASLSHLRRVSTPIEKTGKLIAPRKLHNTQWGYICPSETPEGHSVGVVKNMSSSASVSIYSNVNILKDYFKKINIIIPLDKSTIEEKHSLVRVFINGAWIGSLQHKDVLETIKNLRYAKRSGKIHMFTGIIWKPLFKELWLTTEAGRLLRPLYCAETLREIADDTTGTLLNIVHNIKTWDELILWTSPKENMLIEYIDPGETEGCYIAMKMEELSLDHTHVEIHPSTALGTLASNIPFPDHNQSPRNSYQAAMGKQSMGIYALNFKDRFDTMAHVLCYSQVPFVSPYMSKFYGAQSMPSGQNVIVAIMTYTGYNQEDSIMINRGALDRGLFRSIFYRTYKDEERKNQSSGEEEKFVKPDTSNTKQMKHANYDKLDSDGFIPENTYVDADDILIGKVVPIRVPTGMIVPAGAKRLRDVSRTIRNNETGWVDKIFKNRNGEGYSFVKVRVRQDRIPEIGDKFSSRHGQKGTMGMILNPEDMPQTATGLIPDIIINPHCLSEDHEILTEHGFMNWEEVQAGYMNGKLRIGGYNHSVGKLIYEYPIDFILNETTEREMIEFTHVEEGDRWSNNINHNDNDTNSNGVSLLVTTDHDMFAKKGKIYGESITWDGIQKGSRGESHRIVKDYEKYKAIELINKEVIQFIGKAREGIDNLNIEIPFIELLNINEPEKIQAFCELYGYWLGDGTLRFGGNSVEMSPVKTVDNEWLAERFTVLELIEGQHYTYNVIGGQNESRPIRYRWSIIDKDWFDVFCKEYGNKYTKYKNSNTAPEVSSLTEPESIKSAKWMATWVWTLSSDLAKSLLSGLRFADGCEKADRNVIWTSSARFRDEIMRLALHAGYSTHFTVQHPIGKICGHDKEGREIIARHICWKISYTDNVRGSEPVLNTNRDVKKRYYNGKTWCVTMPNGFIITRRAIRNKEGIVIQASRPIITGQCIPSRMTIAQFMETLLGKVACELGCLGDGSPFNDVTIEGLTSIMRDKLGMEPYGNEILYNGYSGSMMETSIFMGPCYYQRLRHCSADKIHSRSSGPLVMLTRQPAEGRAREGGLRFGEMERDCVIAHGISEFTKERFMECSDLFRCHSCRDCGLIAVTNPVEGIWVCRGCGNTTNFSSIEIPYAYKLLLQELETMNITSRIITQTKLLKIGNKI
jgi:DNA-directed RNA polymerase II subunit RPB2